jgi:hypothetical protein
LAARIQQVAAVTSGAATLTATIAASKANSLIVAYLTVLGTSGAITVKTNSGTSLTIAKNLTTPFLAGVYFLPASPAGVTSIATTFTFNQASLIVAEYSGILASPLDQAAGKDNGFDTGAPNWTSGATAALAQSGDLVLGFASEVRKGTRTFTPGSGFTSVITTSDGIAYMEEMLAYGSTTGIAATGTFSPTTTDYEVMAFVVAFKQAVVATPPPILMYISS